MNPLIGSYIHRIGQDIRDLADVLDEARERIHQQQRSREQLLQHYWNATKELSTLSETAESVDAALNENVRLKSAVLELRERLQAVLTQTKILSDELRQ